MDIDPRHRGYECWAADGGVDVLFSCRGERIGPKPRSCNMGVWWDSDLLRELLDGITISKWDFANARAEPLLTAEGCAANNGSKSNPCLQADILGDWREEVVWRSRDSSELRVYTTPIPAARRQVTLMHDPVYRLGVAWQNVAYNQPPHPGFYMGEGEESFRAVPCYEGCEPAHAAPSSARALLQRPPGRPAGMTAPALGGRI